MNDDKVYLRKATRSDVNLLFDWVNDKDVRKNTFNMHAIAFEEYSSWFDRLLDNRNQAQYILMRDLKPIGQIHLNIDDSDAEIDYSIANDERWYGYGKLIIGLAIKRVREDFPEVNRLIGKVKLSNAASFYCFEKNGFEEKNQQLELYLSTLKENDVMDDTHPRSGTGVKVLYLTNNRNSLDLFDWISKRCDAEIYSDRLTSYYLQAIKPDLIISYNYIYLISQECIDMVGENIINMHISFLPWNRGFSPNIWSFIDDTPKGVTIHMLSAGLDEGDILFQEEVFFDAGNETFQTTHMKLNNMIVDLFKRNWLHFISGEYKEMRRKQPSGGSYHTIADLKQLKDKLPFEWSDKISDFLERYKSKI